MKNRILIAAQRPSDFVEMHRSAEALANRGYDVHFTYFCESNPKIHEFPVMAALRRSIAAGTLSDVSVFNLKQRTFSPVPDEHTLRMNWERTTEDSAALRYIRSRWRQLPEYIRQFAHNMTFIVRRAWRQLMVVAAFVFILREVRSKVSKTKPSAVILPEDVVGSVTPMVVRAARECNAATVIIPYTIANQSEAFQSLRVQPNYRYSSFPNYLVGAIFKKWVMQQDGLALVRLPAAYIIAQELTGTAPPDPWMMNSGFADVIAVENEAMREYYCDAGIPNDKMRVVGAIYDDTLAEFLNNKPAQLAALRAEVGLKTERPLLVIGGCPDQSQSCPRFEFTDMAAFCRKLGAALEPLKRDYDVLVRPHPNYPGMGEMLAASGFRVVTVDTARLVALSDAYIAFGSATIRWAISCGIPAINYDVFGYDYDDYKSVAGVDNVASLLEFEAAVARLSHDGEPYREWLQRARTDAAHWGLLDGKSVERIVGLIEEYCAARRRSADDRDTQLTAQEG